MDISNKASAPETHTADDEHTEHRNSVQNVVDSNKFILLKMFETKEKKKKMPNSVCI